MLCEEATRKQRSSEVFLEGRGENCGSGGCGGGGGK